MPGGVLIHIFEHHTRYLLSQQPPGRCNTATLTTPRRVGVANQFRKYSFDACLPEDRSQKQAGLAGCIVWLAISALLVNGAQILAGLVATIREIVSPCFAWFC